MTDPRLDTTFGKYRIEARLGSGGMGVVYRATDTRLERQVALKLLPPERAADPAFRERFLREGRLAANLRHPHVVTVFEADELDGVLYLAFEYIDGPDLGTILARDGALFDSYHCSRYNTNTGRLTATMFHAVFADIAAHLEQRGPTTRSRLRR